MELGIYSFGGTPMVMGFFAGPEQFVPVVDLYHRAAAAAGHDSSALRPGVHTTTFIQRAPAISN